MSYEGKNVEVRAPEDLEIRVDQLEVDAEYALHTDGLESDDPDLLNDPADHWSPAEAFGNTAAEGRRGESLDQRLAEEEPDVYS